MKKTILVTGGAGFIGSHLCDSLIAAGHHVICLDNLFTGSRKNLTQIADHTEFEFVEHDITSPIHLGERAIDQIYNLACPASPIHYQRNPIHTVKANTIGVIHVLGVARKYGSRVLQASTSEIYGDPLEHPQKETYWGNVNTIGPRACYDEGKRVAETLFFDYHREHGMAIRVARIFNTYGPRMALDDGRVVSNFMVQALKGEALTMYGDGSQTRSFCYVSDMVRGLIALMEKDDFTGPVNLGNPNELSMKEIGEVIIRLTGSQSKLAFQPLPQDDPKKRRPDITLAQEKLSWTPTVSLEEGLKKTIEYFREAVR
ncbi:MAG: NAD-dependent dehydratase [Candidatus Doudnabacteria bacterium RIFCSPHIGHO2_01_FULL_50_11]|uniref:UDP-glucuronate decarboxylase n=1 Tax=Candidatus Doudnabacteria bacterium RIFCSPHIGHO2_01_FULL_50_11 TaxID=1817828 RepID=A0A1F5PEF1_9BACT|nr:MAG: NAD-dependent dehydratase [Candidatus Doudnabacteria bacterium RIFCSPHIGHO2_01_FULL_50_11]HLC44317.1 UDP-glucuronic acid decarboxylase family protein [Patescibacteria group bacterium]